MEVSVEEILISRSLRKLSAQNLRARATIFFMNFKTTGDTVYFVAKNIFFNTRFVQNTFPHRINYKSHETHVLLRLFA